MKVSWTQLLFNLLFILVCMLTIIIHIQTIIAYRSVGSDFKQDYMAAHALRIGKSIYLADSSGRRLTPSVQTSQHTIVLNNHPPAYTILLAPLSYLKYENAYFVLGVASLTALIFCLFIVTSVFDLPSNWKKLFVVVAMVHPASYWCFATGNLSFILSAILVGAWYNLRNGRDIVGGGLLAVAASLKLFPAVMAGTLIVTKKFRAVTSFIVTFITIIACTGLFVHIEDWIAYVTQVAPRTASTYVSHGFNLSIAGAVHRIFGDVNPYSHWLGRLLVNVELATIITLVLCGILIFILTACFLRMAPENRSEDMIFSIFLLTMLLISPLTWMHMFLVLIIPFGMLLNNYKETNNRKYLHIIIISLFFISLPEKIVARLLMDILNTSVLPWYTNLILLMPCWGLLYLLYIFLREAVSVEKIK